MGDGWKARKDFCNQSREEKFIPGPGAYEPDYKADKTKMPAYSMKGRHDDLKRLVVPGPGSYESSLVDKKVSPKFGFGSSP